MRCPVTTPEAIELAACDYEAAPKRRNAVARGTLLADATYHRYGDGRIAHPLPAEATTAGSEQKPVLIAFPKVQL